VSGEASLPFSSSRNDIESKNIETTGVFLVLVLVIVVIVTDRHTSPARATYGFLNLHRALSSTPYASVVRFFA
jgi:hypothetical protein